MNKRQLRQQAIKKALRMYKDGIDYQAIMQMVADDFPQLLEGKSEDDQMQYVYGILAWVENQLGLNR